MTSETERVEKCLLDWRRRESRLQCNSERGAPYRPGTTRRWEGRGRERAKVFIRNGGDEGEEEGEGDNDAKREREREKGKQQQSDISTLACCLLGRQTDSTTLPGIYKLNNLLKEISS